MGNASQFSQTKASRVSFNDRENGASPTREVFALAREELGLNPDELVSPVRAMLSSFFSFAIGAFIPLVPFLLAIQHQLSLSIAFTAVTLCVVGAILSLYTNRNPWLSGLRMLLIGTLAGTVTYLIGSLFKINVY